MPVRRVGARSLWGIRMQPLLRVAAIVALSVAPWIGARAAAGDAVLSDPQPVLRGPLSVGFYGGELYKKPFISIFDAPTAIHLSPSYLAALNVDYRFYESTVLPIVFEGEINVAKRFGAQDQWDVSVVPMARWTWFPWNKTVYTNARLGLGGLSYVTDISPWERQNSGNGIGSRILHFLVPELTFSAGPTSRYEAFIRVHHRSGNYGFFNGVSGGSNYLSAGFRVFL
jgi:hypothetical protein